MKVKQKRYVLLITLALVAVGCIPNLGLRSENPPTYGLLDTVRQHIKAEFVKKDVTENQLQYGAIRGMLASLNDPYSRFIEPKAFNDMQSRMKGEFFGIGIQIGMRNDMLTVIAPITGTPAAKAGLKSLDIITAIDGKSTIGMSLTEAVSLIRGPKGSKVELQIRKPAQRAIRKVSIMRDTIYMNAVEKKEVFVRQNKKIGYLQLTTFENQYATREMQAAIQSLTKQGIDALVVDLRNNGGGLLTNAIEIGGLFLSDATIVQTVNRNGDRKIEKVYGEAQYKGPLVMIINEGSASASEILSGAIKDNGRGILVGTHSFGKASVQRVINLDDGSAVLLTIAHYYTPKGTDISAKGITVNIEAKIPTATIEAAQKPNYVYSFNKDPQLQKAIQVAYTQAIKK